MSKSLATKKTAFNASLEQAPNANGLPVIVPGKLPKTKQDDWHVVRNALLKSVDKRDASGVKRLQLMADKVIDKAIDGDMQAVQFVTERIDGKVVTPVDIKQDITVSSIGQAHLDALNRLTNAVTRHDEAKTIDAEVDTKQSGEPV